MHFLSLDDDIPMSCHNGFQSGEIWAGGAHSIFTTVINSTRQSLGVSWLSTQLRLFVNHRTKEWCPEDIIVDIFIKVSRHDQRCST